jgi:hypothetical protein
MGFGRWSSETAIALATPFPTTYAHTFTNTTERPALYFYVNPSACTEGNVDPTSTGPSALGVVLVMPEGMTTAGAQQILHDLLHPSPTAVPARP